MVAALAGESNSERESKRFEEGLITSICMGWLMQDPDCYLSFGQEPMG